MADKIKCKGCGSMVWAGSKIIDGYCHDCTVRGRNLPKDNDSPISTAHHQPKRLSANSLIILLRNRWRQLSTQVKIASIAVPVIVCFFIYITLSGQMNSPAKQYIPAVESVLNGYGKKGYSNGDWYEGNFVNGQRQGQGHYIWADGSSYVGEWQNGARHGYGRQTWTDGSYYVGAWQNGARHGYGRQTWADGSYYDGEWQNGTLLR